MSMDLKGSLHTSFKFRAMAACANHALWIETLNRIDRISRQHTTGRQPYRKAEWMSRRQLQQPVQTRQQPVTLRGPVCSPYSQKPATDQAFAICPTCKGKRTFFCYMACKCGVKPVTESHTTANVRQAQMTGATGDAGSKDSCPQPCSCSKCPEECHTSCVCGCRKKDCCTQWKNMPMQKSDCQNCCHCNC